MNGTEAEIGVGAAVSVGATTAGDCTGVAMMAPGVPQAVSPMANATVKVRSIQEVMKASYELLRERSIPCQEDAALCTLLPRG